MRGTLALAIGLAASLPVAAQEPGSAPALVRLETLRVEVASRTAASFPARSRMVVVLNAEQLRALPVRTVADALQWVANADVQPRSPAQTDLSLRGSTFEQVLVLVDGVRMSDPQTGHFDLDLAVPLDRVERIEVLVGSASALYGADAVGGVVNVVTREGGSRLAVHVERGSFDSWRAAGSVDGAVAGVSAGGSAEWDHADGHRTGTDYETLQLYGRLSAPVAGGRFSAAAGHGRRDFGANGFYAPFDSYEETRTTTVATGWSGEIGGGFTLHPRLSLRRHGDDFTLIRANPAVYRNVHLSRQRGGELLARRRPLAGRGVALAVGGELYRDEVESDNRATPAAADALGNRSEDRGAAFTELGWAGARASLSGGLRADWHESFGDAWSPSVSGSLDLTGFLRARASWGRSFRAPTWTERYYQDPASIGDPDLEPERSWTLELGAELALPGSGVLRATAFRRQSDDLIDWVKPAGSPPTAPSTVQNVESARYDGLELLVEGVRAGGFRLDAGGSLLSLEAGEAEGLVSRYALRPLVERATARVARALLGGRALLSGQILHERRRGDDPYMLPSARLRVRLPWGELDLGGTNLTDEEHLDVTGNPAAGRALWLGYRLEVDRGR